MSNYIDANLQIQRSRKQRRKLINAMAEKRVRRLRFEPLEERALLAWVAQGPGPMNQGSNVDNVSPNNEVSGAVHAIAAHPTNADILYIGGVNGGVWKTTNATAASPTWTPLTDTLKSQSIGALEFDPTDATRNTLVAGIGRNSSLSSLGDDRSGIIRTTDGGANWTELNGAGTLVGQNISGVAARGSTIVASVNFSDSNSCASLGLFRSTNTGTSFTKLTFGATGMPEGRVFDLVGDPVTTTTLYANVTNATICSAGSLNGIYKSTNSGANWTKVSDAAIDALINNSTPNIEMAVGASNNVYVAIVGTTGQLSGVFRSGNGGSTWTQMDLPTTNEGTAMGIHPGGQGGTHLSIVADPSNANLVYIGGDRQPRTLSDTGTFPNSIGAISFSGRLFRGDASQAAGSQWKHLTSSNSLGAAGGGTSNNSSPHADSREMVFDANGNILEGDDGGIYRRTSPQNNTGAWFSINSNLQISEAHDIAYNSISNSILSGTQDNGTQQQNAGGGTTWASIFGGDGGDVAIDNVTNAGSNQSIRYFSSQNLGNFRRQVVNATNGVVSTTTLPAIGDPQFITPIEVNNVTPTRILVGGSSTLYESTNQGSTLTSLAGVGATGANRNAIVYGGKSLSVNNPDLIYVGKNATVMKRTTSGGSITTTNALPAGAGTVTDVAADPDEWNTVFAIDADQVFMSTNAGVSWSDVTGNLITASGTTAPDLRTIEYIPGTTDAVAVGTRNGVFFAKTSAITTWAKLSTGMPNVLVFDMDYNATDNVLVAGTLGRGSWMLSNATTEINPAAVLNNAGSAITAESMTPNNGFLDPGETVTVNFSLTNSGTSSTTNLVATLQSTGGVASPSGAQTYGIVTAGGAAVTKAFTFTVANGITCGGQVTATLQLQDGANDLGTVPFSFSCGPPPVTGTSSTGNISTPLPDVTTTEIPLVVSNTGVINDLDVKIRLNHTFDSDLDIFVVHPDGTAVELSSDNGGSGQNYGSGANDCSGTPTVFDDAASTLITTGVAPFAGTFKPESPLSALNGKPVNGTWKLRVIDAVSGDSGTAGCFQLVINRISTKCISVWDGGGSTNNFSEAANWTGNVIPQSEGLVQFGSTSTKNATVDAGFAGTVGNVTVNNGYTGTITLARPVISGALIGAIGNVNLGGNTLTVGAENTHTTYSGTVAGTGDLTKTGTGSFYLSGNNSYDGTTTITDGSILVSQNNGLGTIPGPTTVAAGSNARLVFERSVNYTTPEPINLNGSGFNNNGSLVGVGNSSFAGPVLLGSPSTIGAAPAGFTFTLGGNIDKNGHALTFTGAADTVVNGVISGGGGLIKNGTGKLTLTNTNTYTGATTVNAGTLSVTGSNATSATTVNTGATLAGTGTVGAVTAAGGTVSPGNNIGILSGSSANFSAGGILRIGIQGFATPGVSFDRLNLTGALTAGGTSKLSLDLAGLSTTGTANGIVVYGSNATAFTTIELLNNPNSYVACVSNPGGTSLNVTIAIGSCSPPPETGNGGDGPVNPPATGSVVDVEPVNSPFSATFQDGNNVLSAIPDNGDVEQGSGVETVTSDLSSVISTTQPPPFLASDVTSPPIINKIAYPKTPPLNSDSLLVLNSDPGQIPIDAPIATFEPINLLVSSNVGSGVTAFQSNGRIQPQAVDALLGRPAQSSRLVQADPRSQSQSQNQNSPAPRAADSYFGSLSQKNDNNAGGNDLERALSDLTSDRSKKSGEL